MPDDIAMTTRNFHLNDRGGVTYAPAVRFGKPDARSELLADVRVLADATHDLCAAHRAFWPLEFPVPVDVRCALLGADYGLARVRGGSLRRLAEQDAAPGHNPPVRYSVDLADLQLIADVACELDGMRRFYVDRPDEQQRIAALAARLRDMIERVA